MPYSIGGIVGQLINAANNKRYGANTKLGNTVGPGFDIKRDQTTPNPMQASAQMPPLEQTALPESSQPGLDPKEAKMSALKSIMDKHKDDVRIKARLTVNK